MVTRDQPGRRHGADAESRRLDADREVDAGLVGRGGRVVDGDEAEKIGAGLRRCRPPSHVHVPLVVKQAIRQRRLAHPGRRLRRYVDYTGARSAGASHHDARVRAVGRNGDARAVAFSRRHEHRSGVARHWRGRHVDEEL